MQLSTAIILGLAPLAWSVSSSSSSKLGALTDTVRLEQEWQDAQKQDTKEIQRVDGRNLKATRLEIKTNQLPEKTKVWHKMSTEKQYQQTFLEISRLLKAALLDEEIMIQENIDLRTKSMNCPKSSKIEYHMDSLRNRERSKNRKQANELDEFRLKDIRYFLQHFFDEINDNVENAPNMDINNVNLKLVSDVWQGNLYKYEHYDELVSELVKANYPVACIDQIVDDYRAEEHWNGNQLLYVQNPLLFEEMIRKEVETSNQRKRVLQRISLMSRSQVKDFKQHIAFCKRVLSFVEDLKRKTYRK